MFHVNSMVRAPQMVGTHLRILSVGLSVWGIYLEYNSACQDLYLYVPMMVHLFLTTIFRGATCIAAIKSH